MSQIRRTSLGAATILLALALAGIPGPLAAQLSHSPSEPLIYTTVGLGTGSMDLAGQAALTVHVPVGEFTLRLAGVGQFNLFRASDDASDVALLYGHRWVAGTTWLSLGAGPALARATLYGSCLQPSGWGCSSYDVDRRTSAGLAFHVTAGWAGLQSAGLSVTVLGDANAARSFIAVTLNLHLGKIR